MATLDVVFAVLGLALLATLVLVVISTWRTPLSPTRREVADNTPNPALFYPLYSAGVDGHHHHDGQSGHDGGAFGHSGGHSGGFDGGGGGHAGGGH